MIRLKQPYAGTPSAAEFEVYQWPEEPVVITDTAEGDRSKMRPKPRSPVIPRKPHEKP